MKLKNFDLQWSRLFMTLFAFYLSIFLISLFAQTDSSDDAIPSEPIGTHSGLAVDNNGYFYVSGDSTIRKIDPNGLISLLAGAEKSPGTLDGTGSSARFNFPEGLAIDANHNLYVADTNNDTIREITPSGTVTTIAGSAGKEDYKDDVGLNARFDHPVGIVIDGSGTIFVADSGNNAIRKITPNATVTTLARLPGLSSKDVYKMAASGSSGDAFSQVLKQASMPQGLALDASGNIYTCSNGAIFKITPAGVVSILAGKLGENKCIDGPSNIARLNSPVGIVLDGNGDAFVTCDDHTIRYITAAGEVSTLAGQSSLTSYGADGDKSEALFDFPWSITVGYDNHLYVTDEGTIRKVSIDGHVSTIQTSSSPLSP